MKLSKLAGSLVAAYVAIGVVIYIVQSAAGPECNVLLRERQTSGRGSAVMTLIFWPGDLASHAAAGTLGEYFVPRGCV